jgi:hypothetical protein
MFVRLTKYFEQSLKSGTGHTAPNMPEKDYYKLRIRREFVLTSKKCQNLQRIKSNLFRNKQWEPLYKFCNKIKFYSRNPTSFTRACLENEPQTSVELVDEFVN